MVRVHQRYTAVTRSITVRGCLQTTGLASTAVVVKKELSQGLWRAQMVHSNVVEMMVSWGRLGCERVERMWSSSDYIVLACQF